MFLMIILPVLYLKTKQKKFPEIMIAFPEKFPEKEKTTRIQCKKAKD